ncbi:D-hexose-6-phosphate mutarotase [Ferribacterium limneticum]|uniref:D-hexose-6-phosphate mutarotase n=1 Tax=Ferribacterium limneticum TaxID=76259 RepID=UPI001CF9A90F|nr:D-hexose-6-phosphate mutarotase [Ferribacterium limneticum]UCV29910.1 D-hexose-6-phosphate mutarotase [Ferribacterium limneticum]UCV33829.1 D-hexose-6-phosphate mutarotase [Ferribacterium limneticum]
MKPSIEDIEFHGIAALRLNGPRGVSAIVSKQGAQLLSWVTADGRERLFLSDKAVFDGSVAIRGGVPVCFPQFSSLGDLPKHGFVRTRPWTVSAQRTGDDYALVTLECTDDETTRSLWPHSFVAELTVMLETDRIDLELAVTNTGGAPFEFTGALHSYLRVVQVEDVTLEGLHGHDYQDAVEEGRIVRETGTELIIEKEMDRAYHDVRRPQYLKAGNLSLGIQAQGFPDVVVWNPWVDRCAELKDMPADGWRHMLCVEAAATRPVSLPAGEEWYGRQTLVVV